MLLSRNVTRHLGAVVHTARATALGDGQHHVSQRLRCPCGATFASTQQLAAHRIDATKEMA